jgi:hypothetical protein
MTDKRVEARKKAKSRAINLATAHFETMLAGAMRGPIAVPEWDLDVYYKTTSTMAEEARVIELTQEGKTTEGLVVQLIMKALDENSDHLFDMGDKLKLMNNVDPQVILRVVTSMNSDVKKEETKSGN